MESVSNSHPVTSNAHLFKPFDICTAIQIESRLSIKGTKLR